MYMIYSRIYHRYAWPKQKTWM